MKKKIISLLLVLAILLSGTAVVHAIELKDNHANFAADNDLIIEKELGGSLFAAGNNIRVTSSVDGLTFVAGNGIKLSNKHDYIFAAGNDIELDKVETKDAYISGNSIRIIDSKVRDIYVAGSKITVNSEIERDAYFAADKVYINSKIGGDVTVASSNIELGENAEIVGKLKYPKGVELKKTSTTKINEVETYEDADVKVSTKDFIIGLFLTYIYSFLATALLSMFMLFICKHTFAEVKKMKKDASILLTMLIGLVGLIVIPIAAILFMLTLVGIPVSVIGLCFYALLLCLSVVPSVYFFGNWLLGKAIKNDYLMMLVALLIFYVVRLIPFLGGLVEFVALLFGFGCYLVVIKNNISTKKAK